MDVVTRRPVKLSTLGPEYRLAQMFPGVPPDIRNKYRVDWQTIEVPEMVEQLREYARSIYPMVAEIFHLIHPLRTRRSIMWWPTVIIWDCA